MSLVCLNERKKGLQESEDEGLFSLFLVQAFCKNQAVKFSQVTTEILMEISSITHKKF